MQKLSPRGVVGIVIAGGLLALGGTAADAASLSQQIRGTSWHLVSLTMTPANGSKVQPLGPSPMGYAMFDRAGHFIVETLKPGVAKFASGNVREGTDAENRAAVQASLVDFGTYTVDEKNHTLVMHVIGASFPNWIGTDIDNVTEIKGDQMIWNNPSGAQKVPTVLVWERLR